MSSVAKLLSTKLFSSGSEYLDVGLKLFHQNIDDKSKSTQTASGNICIAIELFIKAIIAHDALPLLFTNLSQTIAVKLAAMNVEEDYNLTNIEYFELTNMQFNTVELDKSIGMLFILHPEYKEKASAYKKLLRTTRNDSLHSTIPGNDLNELETLVFLSLSLLEILNAKYVSKSFQFKLDRRSQGFYETYDDRKSQRFKQKIRKAREEAKKINHPNEYDTEDFGDWTTWVVDCPVCGSDAILNGSVEVDSQDKNSADNLFLTFVGDSLECLDCGLELDDRKELEWMKVDDEIDISEYLDEWSQYKYPENPMEGFVSLPWK